VGAVVALGAAFAVPLAANAAGSRFGAAVVCAEGADTGLRADAATGAEEAGVALF